MVVRDKNLVFLLLHSLFITFLPHFLSQVFFFGSSRLVVQDIILGIGSGDSEFTYIYSCFCWRFH
jgi:hypothetical protein